MDGVAEDGGATNRATAQVASTEPASTEPAAAKRRGLESVADMVRSLGIVLAVVAVIVLITLRTPGQAVRPIDYAGTLTQVRQAAPFPALAPQGLPAGWRATSATYDPPQTSGLAGVAQWHLGYVTPSDQYVGLEQWNGDLQALLANQLDGPQQTGTVVLAGVPWTRWTSVEGDRRALTRTGEGAVVVHGTGSWTELETFATALTGPTR